MQSCFAILTLIVGAILLLITLLRWFEQTTEAVDERDWHRVVLLIVAPIAVWLYPSRVSAGRPGPLPRHEPVRGFGGLPKGGIQDPLPESSEAPAPPPAPPSEQSPAPPPGTPKEFLGLPQIPPKKPRTPIDPEKLAKLKQKMKEQGMLPDD